MIDHVNKCEGKESKDLDKDMKTKVRWWLSMKYYEKPYKELEVEQ